MVGLELPADLLLTGAPDVYSHAIDRAIIRSPNGAENQSVGFFIRLLGIMFGRGGLRWNGEGSAYSERQQQKRGKTRGRTAARGWRLGVRRSHHPRLRVRRRHPHFLLPRGSSQ